MILVFGGAYQGKLSYVLDRFGLCADDVYYCGKNGAALPEGKKVIYGLDKWLLELIYAGRDSAEQVSRFIEVNGDAIVICTDITCGVVPTDAAMRSWREATGRALAALARESVEVVRLFCGIPSRLK